MKNLIRGWQIFLVLALVSCAPSAKTRQIADAQRELTLSSAARDKGEYYAALQYAQKAVAANPEMVDAHFAVGKIADDLCVPNANPGPDMRMCNLAIEEYKRVLKIEEVGGPHSEASKDLAFLLWHLRGEESDEFEVYYRKALASDPNDPEALAAIAATNEIRSWRAVALRKVDAGVMPEKPFIGSSGCFEVRKNNLGRVNEGISLLTKALRIESNNSDFMVWLSQLYKTRADIQCGSPQAYSADVNGAKKWETSAYAARRIGGDYSLSRYPPAPPLPPEK